MVTGKSAEVIAVELQESITDKLRVILGEEGVEILTEYVWHMLVSPRCTRQHITQELQEFLADETAGFVDWVLTVIVPKIDTYVHHETPESIKDSTSNKNDTPRPYTVPNNVSAPRESSDTMRETFREETHKTQDSLYRERPPASSECKGTGGSAIHYTREQHGGEARYSALQQKRGRILGLAMQQAMSNNRHANQVATESSLYGRRSNSVHPPPPLSHSPYRSYQDTLGSEHVLLGYRPNEGLGSNTFSPDFSASKSVRKRSPFQPFRSHEHESYRQGNALTSRHRVSPQCNLNHQKHHCVSVTGEKREIRIDSKTSVSSSEESRRHVQAHSANKYKQSEIYSSDGYCNMDNQSGPYSTRVSSKPAFPHGAQPLPFQRPPDYPPSLDARLSGLTNTDMNNILELQEAAAAQGYVLALPNHCALSPAQNLPVNKLKKRCTKWPDCSFGENCRFIHPSEMCNNWPHCPFGEGCFYIHPEVHCKFGLNCHNYNCNYSHPAGWDPTKNSVRYSFNSIYFQNKTLNLMNTTQSDKTAVRTTSQSTSAPLGTSADQSNLTTVPLMQHSMSDNSTAQPLFVGNHDLPTDVDMNA